MSLWQVSLKRRHKHRHDHAPLTAVFIRLSGWDEPEFLQSFMNHVLDEVDLQGGERSSSSLSNHLRDVLGEGGGHGCRQS